MARNGFLVVDSDMHLIEPPDLWPRYLPERFRDRAPVGRTGTPRDISIQMGDGEEPKREGVKRSSWYEVLETHSAPLHKDYQFAIDGKFTAATQLEAMNREGIDIGVQFPSRGLFVLGLDTPEHDPQHGLEPEFASAIAAAYNDWLADFCSLNPARLVPTAMLAPHDPHAAADEARRTVQELGFKAVYLLPGIVSNRPWYHEDYDGLWATCAELGVPVCFHGGGHDPLTDYGVGHRDYLFMWHTFSHCLGPMSAMVAMIGGGVFERHPTLRAAFLEANCSWAPWLIHRLDEEYGEYVGQYEVKLSRKPSEWFVSNCFVSIEADEVPARYYVDAYGDDNVVFSSDYPHPDSKFPHAVDSFLSMPLPDATRRKMLWDNCARLYGLTAPADTNDPAPLGEQATA